ncbi:coiled-coil domain-containing protein [Cetobacterium somerae]|uniref:coiled-coil domain-containing protein n=1 Tax=Cetobacterium somerae TaxID=188913 RepID=UPI003D769204
MNKEKFLEFLKDSDIKLEIKKIYLEDLKEEDLKSSEGLLDMMKKFVIEVTEEDEINLSGGEKENMQKLLEIIRNMFFIKDKTLAEKSKEISEIEIENKTLVNEIEAVKKESTLPLQKKLDFYREQFENQIKAYSLYKDLSPRAIKSLENIFKGDSIDTFMACGIQKDNINSLWYYIKNEIIEEREEDIEKLKFIFEYLFNLYIIPNDYCIWQDIKIGDKFDTFIHIAHSKGRASGEVKEIILRGYLNKNTKKIINKSVVLVG